MRNILLLSFMDNLRYFSSLYHIFIILCNIIIDMIFNLPEGWQVFGIQEKTWNEERYVPDLKVP